ncbi:MAG: hypothetical protein CUN57_03690, partial [Phototrophicales bacterium]
MLEKLGIPVFSNQLSVCSNSDKFVGKRYTDFGLRFLVDEVVENDAESDVDVEGSAFAVHG